MSAQNSLKNFEPALAQGYSINLSNLDIDGATNGQVLTMVAGSPAWA